jgi:hypothetical protein
MARLWDVTTRTLRVPPLRHPGWVWSVAIGPEGDTVLTGCEDGKARLWDLATGVPLGPAIPHPHPVNAVRFGPDGATFFTMDRSATCRVFRRVAGLPDDLNRVAAWVETLTGLSLDPQRDALSVLEGAAWRSARGRLNRLGGAPETREDQRLDPIVFGPNPTDRIHAWVERRQWAKARAAYDEFRLARPLMAELTGRPLWLDGKPARPQRPTITTTADRPPESVWSRLLAEIQQLIAGGHAHLMQAPRPAAPPARASEPAGVVPAGRAPAPAGEASEASRSDDPRRAGRH